MAAGAGGDFGPGLGIRLRSPIRPVTGYCIERVRYRENPRIQMYGLAGESGRVAAIIKLFVMLADDRRRARQKVDALNYGQAVIYVLFHLNPLVLRKRSGLQKYGVTHAD